MLTSVRPVVSEDCCEKLRVFAGNDVSSVEAKTDRSKHFCRFVPAFREANFEF